MTFAATARQKFFDALLDFYSVRSPSIELRGRLAGARADAEKLLARADYGATVLAARLLSPTF